MHCAQVAFSIYVHGEHYMLSCTEKCMHTRQTIHLYIHYHLGVPNGCNVHTYMYILLSTTTYTLYISIAKSI